MSKESSVDQLNRHHSLGLSDQDVVDMYHNMVMARQFDERAHVLQRAGKIAFHVSGIGQEPAQVAAAFALKRDRDFFLPYYRDYAFVLSVGMTLEDLFLSIFAKQADISSGGRQMPGHFSKKSSRIVTMSSPVATQIPHAVGIALASKMHGRDEASFVTFGEGSSNQGDFHEGCNFAGVHKLPVILMCENNQYAISVPLHKQVAGKISDRAQGYGFPGVRVDGNDVLEVYSAVKEARERASRGEGPTLIETMMYRIPPHSTSDNDLLYRSEEEVQEHRAKDGIVKFHKYLLDCGLWDDEKEQALLEENKKIITDATRTADEASAPLPEDTLLHVYANDGKEG